jgi:hypothetical protein
MGAGGHAVEARGRDGAVAVAAVQEGGEGGGAVHRHRLRAYHLRMGTQMDTGVMGDDAFRCCEAEDLGWLRGCAPFSGCF